MNDEPRRAPVSFDASAWTKALLALNPLLVVGGSISEDDEAFNAARQKATLERYSQGKEVWNAWASGMIALKSDLDNAGRWATARRHHLGVWEPPLTGDNAETDCLLLLAAAMFSSQAATHTFAADVSFDEFIFPGRTSFAGATFSGDADFKGATFSAHAKFDDATFSGYANFGNATFSGSANFGGATFSGHAYFDEATFSSSALFWSTTYSETASFSITSFLASADFEGATFSGGADFRGAIFSGETLFRGAIFRGDTNFAAVRFEAPILFATAKFEKPVDLSRCVFRRRASFEAINSEATFSLADATFREVPSLFGAAFKGTLRLDNVQTPRFPLLGWTSDKEAPARFRELKRRAAEAQDHDRELEFFAQEIRTSRFHAKRLPGFVPRVWEWRFWFGLLFGMFSDFGRSLWRPVLFWVALFVGFSIFYLGEHEDMKKARLALNPNGAWSTLAAYAVTTRAARTNPPTCSRPGKDDPNKVFAATDAVSEALYLSLKNAIVFDAGRTDVSRRIYGCLYGLDRIGDQDNLIVPYRVSVASTAQGVASAVLIFLFLLAVRNLLRLK